MNLPLESRTRCWAEIDLSALRHNARVAREAAGPGASLLAVVKADAYGHGMGPIARALHAEGLAERFAVANVAEAIALRGHLPDAPVTILSPALPDERPEIVRHGFLPWVSTPEEAGDYARLAREQCGEGAPFGVVIVVDTGMGREGVLPGGLGALRQTVEALSSLRWQGTVTHLPSADEDTAFTAAELAGFEHLLAAAPPAGERHAQNSAGLLGFPPPARCNVVRPGLMLYGASPLPEHQARLRPVLTLKTRVSLVRDLPAGHGVSYGRTFVTDRPTRVGTLAAGYADGYPRHLSNAGAEVLVRGRRCPVLGRVTMDQVMINLGALPAVGAGEEVVLLGRQGTEEIPVAELAARAGTIPWEIFTGLTTRVGRYYAA
ncbi:MAG: alanine racemase [Gluconacetobacter diazotrophicus]|nr:alanine racemase [Gluconacetobacter diazotrophicus]